MEKRCLYIEWRTDILVYGIIRYREINNCGENKKIFNPDFNGVYCKSNLDILIKRDTKRLYSKAISGELNNLTGISFNTPYEPPSDPNIIIKMGENNIDESLNY